MLESIKTAKDHDFEAIQCMALSLYSQKICKKNGFKPLFCIKYADYLQTADDKKFFTAEKMGDHQEGILYVCKL